MTDPVKDLVAAARRREAEQSVTHTFPSHPRLSRTRVWYLDCENCGRALVLLHSGSISGSAMWQGECFPED